MRVLLLLCLSASLEAATYYIDFVGGSNAANGTSTSTPWKHSPGMQGCTGVCASTTPVAGDRFIFKGGVTWDKSCFQMAITWSGSAGSVIYFGVDQAWYTGTSWTRPVFDGEHAALASGTDIVRVISRNYVTLDNIEIKRHRFFGTFGEASVNHSCNTYFTMQNLFVHDWDVNTGITSDAAQGGVIGNYPSCAPTGVILTHSTVSNAEAKDRGQQNGVAVRQTDVAYSVIHDVATAQLYGLMHDTEVYNVSWPATGRGVVGSNQEFDVAYHDNNAFIASWDGMNMAYTRPGLFYNNVIHDIKSASGAIYPAGCASTGFFIFNNAVYNSHWGAVVNIDQNGEAGTCGEYYIWNNTFQVPPDYSTNMVGQVDRGVTISVLNTRNNHYITENATTVSVIAAPTTRTDSNNLTQTNAQATTAGYLETTAYFPPPGGATIGAGANLSSLGITALNSDKNGVARGSTWDVGAYEYSAPPPPTTFRGVMRSGSLK